MRHVEIPPPLQLRAYRACGYDVRAGREYYTRITISLDSKVSGIYYIVICMFSCGELKLRPFLLKRRAYPKRGKRGAAQIPLSHPLPLK
jgi:hypothetical protein